MRTKLVRVVLAVLAITAVCGNSEGNRSAASLTASPYLGQELPGETPVMFAPGIVSHPAYREYSGTFSTDLKEYYFYRFSDTTVSTIYQCKVVGSEWTAPTPVGFSAGFPAAEPHLTHDNSLLYFNWRTGTSPAVWFTSRVPEGWAEPQFAGQGMFVSSDSTGAVYVTDMSSYFVNGRTYLASVTLDNGVFAAYQRLSIDAHYGSQAHPCIARDRSYMIFDVQGGQYMYVSFRNPDSTWGEAIDLTVHGFDPKAGGATLSPDGNYLFFHLSGDIWWVDAQVIEELRPSYGCCTLEGDVDAVQDGVVDLTDLQIYTDFLFFGAAPSSCFDGWDNNDDAVCDLSDLQTLIDYLFFSVALPICP